MPWVRLAAERPVARLTLARPPLNVFTIEMMEQALEAIRRADWRGVRVCVLEGEGRAFSAGVDVGEHLGTTCGPMIRTFHALFRALTDLPCALVARVHGACLGGGTELLLACDSVVAAEDATLGFPEIRLGVFPPIACAHLWRVVGATRARRMILTGETVTGKEAADLGLVTRSVPAAGLDEAIAREAAAFAGHSAAAIRETRRAMAGADLHQIEDLYLGGLMATRDATEGLRAFLEKRHADWSDR